MVYKTLENKTVFDGKIVNVCHDIISLPNGQSALREVVVHKSNGAAVLPVDKDGRLIFVKQYRHPIKKMMLEIPAGCINKDEDPALCASRELEEETGHRCDKLKFMFKIHASVGWTTESISVYLAENLTEGTVNLDEDEFVDVHKLTLEEALGLIDSGELTDSKTLAAILWYARHVKDCC